MTKSQKQLFSVYGIGVLIAMLIFFLRAHPLIVFDTDDWLYIFYARLPFPLWGDWNPTRIFPEVFMSLCSQVAVWLVYPIWGDYIGALSLVHGVVLSLFVTIYVLTFTLFTQKRLHATFASSVISGILFLLMHFWVFRCSDSSNSFLFAADDTTCVFYYTIPALLNLTLIFLFESFPHLTDLHTPSHLWEKGILLALVYFAVFSNLFSSYILAIWAGVDWLCTGYLLYSSRKKNTTKDPALVSRFVYELAIVLAWLLSVVYEINGGRADSLEKPPFFDSLCDAVSRVKDRILSCNPVFSGFAVVSVLLFLIEIFIAFARKKANPSVTFFFPKGIFILSLCVIYLILSGSKAGLGYICRPEVQLGVFSVAFVVLCGIVIYFINAYPRLLAPISLALILVCFQINTPGVTFDDTSYSGKEWQACYTYSRYVFDELTRAEQEHLTEYELHVPVYESWDNFPLAPYGCRRFCNALLCHGIIPRRMTVTLIPDPEINARFGL